MNSHDPDFPQDIPAIPEAETATPPEDAVLGKVGEAAFQEPSAVDSAVHPSSATDPSAMEASVTESSAPEPSTPEAPTSATPAPAAEVWTELDEAEPRAVVEGRAEDRHPSPWSQAMAKERGEPDPSVLDAGSGMRREAEKPGRTVLPYDDWEPSEVPYQPKELGVIDQLMIVLADGAVIWRKGLRQVRSWLPITWQRRLSDELMTAIALGLLILWLVLWNPLGGRGATPGVTVEEPGMAAPTLSSGGDDFGNVAINPGDGGEASPVMPPDSPADAPEPSPEQNLIADIQERVSQISRSYAVGLIQSVEVNLPQQVLAVNLSNDWYGLGTDSQGSIAQDIYTQAQGLAFAKLQLRDAEGVVVARNPVVGTAMVILKRHRPLEGDPLA